MSEIQSESPESGLEEANEKIEELENLLSKRRSEINPNAVKEIEDLIENLRILRAAFEKLILINTEAKYNSENTNSLDDQNRTNSSAIQEAKKAAKQIDSAFVSQVDNFIFQQEEIVKEFEETTKHLKEIAQLQSENNQTAQELKEIQALDDLERAKESSQKLIKRAKNVRAKVFEIYEKLPKQQVLNISVIESLIVDIENLEQNIIVQARAIRESGLLIREIQELRSRDDSNSRKNIDLISDKSSRLTAHVIRLPGQIAANTLALLREQVLFVSENSHLDADEVEEKFTEIAQTYFITDQEQSNQITSQKNYEISLEVSEIVDPTKYGTVIKLIDNILHSIGGLLRSTPQKRWNEFISMYSKARGYKNPLTNYNERPKKTYTFYDQNQDISIEKTNYQKLNIFLRPLSFIATKVFLRSKSIEEGLYYRLWIAHWYSGIVDKVVNSPRTTVRAFNKAIFWLKPILVDLDRIGNSVGNLRKQAFKIKDEKERKLLLEKVDLVEREVAEIIKGTNDQLTSIQEWKQRIKQDPAMAAINQVSEKARSILKSSEAVTVGFSNKSPRALNKWIKQLKGVLEEYESKRSTIDYLNNTPDGISLLTELEGLIKQAEIQLEEIENLSQAGIHNKKGLIGNISSGTNNQEARLGPIKLSGISRSGNDKSIRVRVGRNPGSIVRANTVNIVRGAVVDSIGIENESSTLLVGDALEINTDSGTITFKIVDNPENSALSIIEIDSNIEKIGYGKSRKAKNNLAVADRDIKNAQNYLDEETDNIEKEIEKYIQVSDLNKNKVKNGIKALNKLLKSVNDHLSKLEWVIANLDNRKAIVGRAIELEQKLSKLKKEISSQISSLEYIRSVQENRPRTEETTATTNLLEEESSRFIPGLSIGPSGGVEIRRSPQIDIYVDGKKVSSKTTISGEIGIITIFNRRTGQIEAFMIQGTKAFEIPTPPWLIDGNENISAINTINERARSIAKHDLENTYGDEAWTVVRDILSGRLSIMSFTHSIPGEEAPLVLYDSRLPSPLHLVRLKKQLEKQEKSLGKDKEGNKEEYLETAKLLTLINLEYDQLSQPERFNGWTLDVMNSKPYALTSVIINSLKVSLRFVLVPAFSFYMFKEDPLGVKAWIEAAEVGWEVYFEAGTFIPTVVAFSTSIVTSIAQGKIITWAFNSVANAITKTTNFLANGIKNFLVINRASGGVFDVNTASFVLASQMKTWGSMFSFQPLPYRTNVVTHKNGKTAFHLEAKKIGISPQKELRRWFENAKWWARPIIGVFFQVSRGTIWSITGKSWDYVNTVLKKHIVFFKHSILSLGRQVFSIDVRSLPVGLRQILKRPSFTDEIRGLRELIANTSDPRLLKIYVEYAKQSLGYARDFNNEINKVIEETYEFKASFPEEAEELDANQLTALQTVLQKEIELLQSEVTLKEQELTRNGLINSISEEHPEEVSISGIDAPVEGVRLLINQIVTTVRNIVGGLIILPFIPAGGVLFSIEKYFQHTIYSDGKDTLLNKLSLAIVSGINKGIDIFNPFSQLTSSKEKGEENFITTIIENPDQLPGFSGIIQTAKDFVFRIGIAYENTPQTLIKIKDLFIRFNGNILKVLDELIIPKENQQKDCSLLSQVKLVKQAHAGMGVTSPGCSIAEKVDQTTKDAGTMFFDPTGTTTTLAVLIKLVTSSFSSANILKINPAIGRMNSIEEVGIPKNPSTDTLRTLKTNRSIFSKLANSLLSLNPENSQEPYGIEHVVEVVRNTVLKTSEIEYREISDQDIEYIGAGSEFFSYKVTLHFSENGEIKQKEIVVKLSHKLDLMSEYNCFSGTIECMQTYAHTISAINHLVETKYPRLADLLPNTELYHLHGAGLSVVVSDHIDFTRINKYDISSPNSDLTLQELEDLGNLAKDLDKEYGIQFDTRVAGNPKTAESFDNFVVDNQTGHIRLLDFGLFNTNTYNWTQSWIKLTNRWNNNMVFRSMLKKLRNQLKTSTQERGGVKEKHLGNEAVNAANLVLGKAEETAKEGSLPQGCTDCSLFVAKIKQLIGKANDPKLSYKKRKEAITEAKALVEDHVMKNIVIQESTRAITETTEALTEKELADMSSEEIESQPKTFGKFGKLTASSIDQRARAITETEQALYAIENAITKIEEGNGAEESTRAKNLRNQLSQEFSNLHEILREVYFRQQYFHNHEQVEVDDWGDVEKVNITKMKIPTTSPDQPRKVLLYSPGYSTYNESIDSISHALATEGYGDYTEVWIAQTTKIPKAINEENNITAPYINEASLIVSAIEKKVVETDDILPLITDETTDKLDITIAGYSAGANISTTLAGMIKAFSPEHTVRQIMFSTTGMTDFAENPLQFLFQNIVQEITQVAGSMFGINTDPSILPEKSGSAIEGLLTQAPLLGKILGRVRALSTFFDLIANKTPIWFKELMQIYSRNPFIDTPGVIRTIVVPANDIMFPVSMLSTEGLDLPEGISPEERQKRIIAHNAGIPTKQVEVIGKEGSFTANHLYPGANSPLMVGKAMEILRESEPAETNPEEIKEFKTKTINTSSYALLASATRELIRSMFTGWNFVEKYIPTLFKRNPKIETNISSQEEASYMVDYLINPKTECVNKPIKFISPQANAQDLSLTEDKGAIICPPWERLVVLSVSLQDTAAGRAYLETLLSAFGNSGKLNKFMFGSWMMLLLRYLYSSNLNQDTTTQTSQPTQSYISFIPTAQQSSLLTDFLQPDFNVTVSPSNEDTFLNPLYPYGSTNTSISGTNNIQKTMENNSLNNDLACQLKMDDPQLAILPGDLGYTEENTNIIENKTVEERWDYLDKKNKLYTATFEKINEIPTHNYASQVRTFNSTEDSISWYLNRETPAELLIELPSELLAVNGVSSESATLLKENQNETTSSHVFIWTNREYSISIQLINDLKEEEALQTLVKMIEVILQKIDSYENECDKNETSWILFDEKKLFRNQRIPSKEAGTFLHAFSTTS
ncbi:hypothetical protein ACFL1M_04145 [Patescibacteria group bacterium]